MRGKENLTKFGQAGGYYNPLKHLETQGTLGSGTARRFARGDVKLDFETDIANFKSLILLPELYMLINESVISKWNADQQDNYADLVAYGAQLICELKHQLTQVDYIPSLTRSDVTAGSTFTRSTMTSLLMSLSEMRLPIESYTLSKLYCKVIQMHGSEFQTGYPAEFFYPWKPYKTAAEIETLMSTIAGLYDAVVYASQANKRLVQLTPEFLKNIDEVAQRSHFGLMISELYPISDDAGVDYVEVDETLSALWHQLQGIPEQFIFSALWRCTSASDSPKILTISNSAAGKLSVAYAKIGDLVFTQELDTAYVWDWIYAAASNRSVDQVGPFVHSAVYPYMTSKSGIAANELVWNRWASTALAIKSKVASPTIEEVSDSLLMDYVGSPRHRTTMGLGKSKKSTLSKNPNDPDKYYIPGFSGARNPRDMVEEELRRIGEW